MNLGIHCSKHEPVVVILESNNHICIVFTGDYHVSLSSGFFFSILPSRFAELLCRLDCAL